MANGHGGIRPNSGRKKKSLEQNILEGKIKKTEPTLLKIDNNIQGEDMPAAKEYMLMQTKGAGENRAATIYKETWNWLKQRKCEHLVQPALLQKYAMAEARFAQTEEAVHTFGFLAKHPTTGAPISSPYVKISLDYAKQSANLWYQIQTLVVDHLEDNVQSSGSEFDMMEYILSYPPKIINPNKE